MNDWEEIGTKIVVDDKSYVANCNMKNGMSFDDMHLIMYNKKLIDAYEIGKASSLEILDVLCYASEYFKSKQKQKKK